MTPAHDLLGTVRPQERVQFLVSLRLIRSMSCLFSKGACGRERRGAEQCAHLRVREEAPGLWCSLAPLATPERLGWHLIRYDGTCFFLWGADGAVAMLEDVAHGHYGTGLNFTRDG